jgi:hypothetical protein
MCYGCIVDADNNLPLFDILKYQSFMAIDWNFDFYKEYFNDKFLKPLEHETLKDSGNNMQKEVTLIDCLKMFESVEEIPVREGVNCEKCKKPTHH